MKTFIVILLIAGAGFGVYWFVFRKKDNNAMAGGFGSDGKSGQENVLAGPNASPAQQGQSPPTIARRPQSGPVAPGIPAGSFAGKPPSISVVPKASSWLTNVGQRLFNPTPAPTPTTNTSIAPAPPPMSLTSLKGFGSISTAPAPTSNPLSTSKSGFTTGTKLKI